MKLVLLRVVQNFVVLTAIVHYLQQIPAPLFDAYDALRPSQAPFSGSTVNKCTLDVMKNMPFITAAIIRSGNEVEQQDKIIVSSSAHIDHNNNCISIEG